MVEPQFEALELKKGEEVTPVVPGPSQSLPKEEVGAQNCLLPEGFFDDARRDAEARNVPFKDKMDAEMEIFRREMGTLNQVGFLPSIIRIDIKCVCYLIVLLGRNRSKFLKRTMKRWLLRGIWQRSISKCRFCPGIAIKSLISKS